MTVYAIAQLRFTDRDAYDRYQAAFMEVFERYSGRLLAADEAPHVVEGRWDRDKVVLMAFPDEHLIAVFTGWEIIKDSARTKDLVNRVWAAAGKAQCGGKN